jgi:hypothetical protein
MEEKGLKMTVVGALVIVLAVIGAICLIRHCQQRRNRGREEPQS